MADNNKRSNRRRKPKANSTKNKEKLYHINGNGQVGECNAVTRCPFGGINAHFKDINKAQEYADKLNEKLSNVKYGPTSVKLSEKRNSVSNVIRSQDLERRLYSVNTKINDLLDVTAYKQYLKLKKTQERQGQKPIKMDKFYEDFKKNNTYYHELLAKKKKTLHDVNKLVQERINAFHFEKDFNDRIVDVNYSNASSSAYFVIKEAAYNDTIDYLNRNNIPYMVRPDMEVALKDDFMLRMSDHTPGNFNYSGEAEGKTVWDFTDASILVFYKEIEDNKVNDKTVREKINELKKCIFK